MSLIKTIFKATLGLFLLMVIAAFVFGVDSDDSETNDIEITDVSQGDYSIGDRVVVGEVAYTIISADADKGDPAWIDLGVEIENLGKNTREYYLPDNNIKLISENEQEYLPLNGFTTWERGFDELRPGIPMEVYLVFEVPRGQRYYAEVGDSFWDGSERIDIGVVPA